MRRHGISLISNESIGVTARRRSLGVCFLEPRLKHQDIPKMILPVALSRQVLPPALADGILFLLRRRWRSIQALPNKVSYDAMIELLLQYQIEMCEQWCKQVWKFQAGE